MKKRFEEQCLVKSVDGVAIKWIWSVCKSMGK